MTAAPMPDLAPQPTDHPEQEASMGVSVRAVPGLPVDRPLRIENVASRRPTAVHTLAASIRVPRPSPLLLASFVLSAGIAGLMLGASSSLPVTLLAVGVGSLGLGVGAFLSARMGHERSARSRADAAEAFIQKSRAGRHEVVALLSLYGVALTDDAPLAHALARKPSAWRDFQGRFDKDARAPELARALRDALRITAAYAAGGVIVLLFATVVRLVG